MSWASSSCVNQQLSCLLALLKFTHSYLVSSTRLVRRADDFIFDEKFDLLFLFEFQVFLSQAPCVLNDKFFNGMFHLQQVLKRPYGPPLEMVSGNTGARGFRAGRSELSAARSTFQCNKTKETTSRWEKDVLGSMAIHVMTYVVKGEERER